MGKMVKLVEEMNIDLASVTTNSGVLSKGQVTANCVPFGSYYVSTGVSNWSYAMRDIYFSTTGSSGTVEINRSAASTTSNYNTVYVVEFDSAEVKIQSGTFTISGTTSTTVSGFTSVVPSNTAVVFYHKSSSSDQNVAYHAVRGVLTDSGTLTFTVGIAGSIINGHWYLMEDLNNHFTVDQLSFTMGGSYDYEFTTPFNYHQHLLICSYTYNNGDSNSQHGHVKADSYDEDRLYFSRSAANATFAVNAFLIKFDKSEDIYMGQRHSGYLDTATTSRTITHQDATVSGFGMVMHSIPSMCTSHTNNGTPSAVYCMTTRVKLSGINQTIVSRAGTNSSYVYAPHQIFDWSEVANTKPATEPKLSTLSGINSMVRSIEHISTSFSGSDTNIQCIKYAALTKGQNVKNCIPFVTSRSSSSNGQSNYLVNDFRMMEPNRLRIHRDWFEDPSIADYEIDIVEFEPDQVRVQQGYFITSSGSALATISGVDLTKAAVRAYNITNNTTAGGLSAYGWGRTRFSASGTLIFERGTTDGMAYGHYYVFEALADQFTVQAYDDSGSGGWSRYMTAEAPLNRSFILNSYYASTTDTNTVHHFAYAQLFPYRWFTQGNKYSAGVTTYSTTYVITLKKNPINPTNVLTQHYFTEFGSGDLTRNITLRHSLTATSGTVIALNPAPYAGGYFNSGTTSYASATYVAYKFSNVDTVELKRSVTNSTTIRSSLQTIDFVGYEIPDDTRPACGENDFVLSTQHNEFTISGSSYELDYLKDLPLTKGQDINNCVPFFSYKLDSSVGLPSYLSHRPAIVIDNGEYHVIKASGGTEHFSADIVEFNPARVKIQHGEFHLTNTSGTHNVTISGVSSLENAFMIFHWYPNTNYTNYGTHAVRGRFTSTSGLEFYRYESSYLMSGHWWVVESLDNSFVVDHSTFTVNASNYDTVTNKANTLDRSFMFYSFYYASTDYNAVHGGTRGYFGISPPNLLSYVDKYSTGVNTYVAAQTVTFTGSLGVNSQHQMVYMQNGVDTTKNYGLADMVDIDRYAVVYPNLFHMPYCPSGDTNWILNGVCRFRLNSSGTQIECSRRANTYDNYLSYFVLEFPEYNQYYFSGTVKAQGVPAEREVLAYRRDTGELIGTTTSVSGTGAFYLETTHSGDHYVVCLDDSAGDVYNALVYDYIIPVTIS
jgi:hypothetical protein